MTTFENVMEKDLSEYSKKQIKEICEGKLCPECFGKNIKRTGLAPDGMNMNYRYECKDCKEGWEGY